MPEKKTKKTPYIVKTRNQYTIWPSSNYCNTCNLIGEAVC